MSLLYYYSSSLRKLSRFRLQSRQHPILGPCRFNPYCRGSHGSRRNGCSDHEKATKSEGTLRARQSLYSDNGHARLDLQGDGNLVIHRTCDSEPIWDAGSYLYKDQPPTELRMQADGDLVMSTASGEVVWRSFTGHNTDFTDALAKVHVDASLRTDRVCGALF
ncbi:hypothetical protein BV898_01604 [Hypsibius exemplaris]|uniref:Bulb-type lectin domain-containing protein n=1 Tax=Hypsibius exemplaris TaxID=2072580 RepID=A0A1W0XAV8_HYPEX|nr:hypothetical protein BV898_01604 [Hypsibius exemplaris]